MSIPQSIPSIFIWLFKIYLVPIDISWLPHIYSINFKQLRKTFGDPHGHFFSEKVCHLLLCDFDLSSAMASCFLFALVKWNHSSKLFWNGACAVKSLLGDPARHTWHVIFIMAFVALE